jgi:hypothetical protein
VVQLRANESAHLNEIANLKRIKDSLDQQLLAEQQRSSKIEAVSRETEQTLQRVRVEFNEKEQRLIKSEVAVR